LAEAARENVMLATVALKTAATYVALHAILLIVLAGLVVRERRRAKVGIGDGGDPRLKRAIRVHGNAVEQAVPTMALLIVLPLLAAPLWAIHLFGAATLLGRVLHAAGLGKSEGVTLGRQVGMILCWLAIIAASCGIFVLALR
jgi:uncharacterized membrane protein YecN with MAPEG domain